MLNDYLVHASPGRARLRHPVFKAPETRDAAQRLLASEPGVREVRQGDASLLLLLTAEADLAGLCAKLEAALPDLGRAAAPRLGPAGDRRNRGGLSLRRWELRVLSGVFGVCLASGLAGRGGLHRLTGLACAILTARHIWRRRAAL